MGDVAPGADVIAVLPFTTSGDDVEVLGEGMVDLLSRNLNQPGVIRTVDPRAVLFRWQERAQEERLPPEAAYALGRDVGAGSIVWGNVLEVGGTVRMNAELVDVDGTQLASAEVEGPADEVLKLVDSLSVALVQEIWRTTRPMPSIDLSNITTGDLTAIRHFLDGERHYRSSQWDSAVAAFSAAVEADSTFALAYVRLSYTSGWASNTLERRALERRAAAKAVELIDRLGSRSQTLVRALERWVGGRRQEAVDTLRSLVQRYPDDLEGLYFLADARFHITFEGLGPRRPPLREALEPFERIHDVDPSFAPAFIHPLEVAFGRADTAAIGLYYRTLRSRSDTLALSVYRAGAEAIERSDDIDALAEGLRRAFVGADEGLGGLGWQASRAVRLPLLRAAATLDAGARGNLYNLFRADESGPRDTSGPELRARREAEVRLLQSGGRLAEARRLIEESLDRDEMTPALAGHHSRMPVFAGLADSTYLLLGDAHRPGMLAWQLAGLLSALDSEDPGRARIAGELLRNGGSEQSRVTRAHLAEVAERFAEFDADPSAARIEAIEAALADEPFVPGRFDEPLWFRWLERLAEHSETRRDAIEMLERPWIGEAVYEAPRIYSLARALEAEGEGERARNLYLQFLSAMAAADDGLLIDAKVEAAREALGRLGG
jgi:TolB-like protein/tetratricopeptide (TPR) repeat protein